MTQADTPNVVTVRAHLPQAQDVHLIGPFNNWSTTATPMKREGAEDWEVSLPAGTELTAYCFFVWEIGRVLGHVIRPGG